MFLSHNPVTPAETSPPDSLLLNAAQLLLCFGLIAQQQQRIKCSPRTVCPQCNPTHFVHCQHHMGREQMLSLRFRTLTSHLGKRIKLSKSVQKQICLCEEPNQNSTVEKGEYELFLASFLLKIAAENTLFFVFSSCKQTVS